MDELKLIQHIKTVVQDLYGVEDYDAETLVNKIRGTWLVPVFTAYLAEKLTVDKHGIWIDNTNNRYGLPGTAYNRVFLLHSFETEFGLERMEKPENGTVRGANREMNAQREIRGSNGEIIKTNSPADPQEMCIEEDLGMQRAFEDFQEKRYAHNKELQDGFVDLMNTLKAVRRLITKGRSKGRPPYNITNACKLIDAKLNKYKKEG